MRKQRVFFFLIYTSPQRSLLPNIRSGKISLDPEKTWMGFRNRRRKLPKKILAVVSSARCKVFPSITSFRFYRRFQISDFILVSDICTHLYSVTSITSVIIASMGVVPLWQSFDLFIQTGNMTVSLTIRTFQGLYCQNLIYRPRGAS